MFKCVTFANLNGHTFKLCELNCPESVTCKEILLMVIISNVLYLPEEKKRDKKEKDI